ncbi:MAG: polysaccharide biosynthesis/export family protein [Steroidobacteraceae bacterium]|jgi:polysaccharide export outer membrane protein
MIFVGVLSTAWCCSALADEPVTPAASAPVAGAAGAGSPAMAPPSSDAVPKPAPGFTPVATPTSNSNAVSKDYLLQPGDELQIAVWKETDLTADVFIRPDGGISFPLAGDLPAAGHTVADLTAMLEKRVRRYEPDAVVTVMVKAAIGNRVYVIGKVNRPGDFALNRPIDVMQALSLAGGATPFANTNHIRVLRRDGDHIKAIAFRYGDVQRGRRLDQNILLKSGDTVVVP